eukprot:Gb_28387 [translate_table: standard]
MNPFKAKMDHDVDQSLLLAVTETRTKRRLKLTIISVASLALVTILFFVAAGILRPNANIEEQDGDAADLQQPVNAINAVCEETLYPEVCVSSLSSYPGASRADTKKLLGIAVMVAVNEANKAFALASNILAKQADDGSQSTAVHDCVTLLDLTKDQLRSVLSDLTKFNLKYSLTRGQQSGDVQTLLSASITNQDTCLDGLAMNTNANDGNRVLQSTVQHVTELVSNSLAMVKTISSLFPGFEPRNFDNQRLQSHRKEHYNSRLEFDSHYGSLKDGFPSWLSAGDRVILQASQNIAVVESDVIVAQDGSGNYKTITEAVNAAPEKSNKRYIIKVKKGTYEEYVEVGKKKTNLMIIGDGMDQTIVTGSKNVVDNSTTFNSATFAAVGMGFIAQDIAFVNTAGPSKHQAVALRVGSDQSVLYRCKIVGYQDSLYVHSLRQFYRECTVLGTVDFIFGNAAVVFQSCTLLARKPMQNQKNAITAQGRTDPNQNTGISIHNCVIAADTDLVPVKASFPTYLGRPWKEYSRTVYMLSTLDDVIHPAGWLEWSGDFALSTLYYGEYMNSGPGAGTDDRIKWPGYHVITSADEARKFTVGEFIQGNSWLQSTGVDYVDGLTE